jgi:hypothetical protein
MHDNRLRSRLEAQFTKFSLPLTEGLSRSLQEFVRRKLFGVRLGRSGSEAGVHRWVERVRGRPGLGPRQLRFAVRANLRLLLVGLPGLPPER